MNSLSDVLRLLHFRKFCMEVFEVFQTEHIETLFDERGFYQDNALDNCEDIEPFFLFFLGFEIAFVHKCGSFQTVCNNGLQHHVLYRFCIY